MSSIINKPSSVNLYFSWTGDVQWRNGATNGGLSIEAIHLTFKNNVSAKVSIPQKLSPKHITQLPFMCSRSNEVIPSSSLHVPIEIIKTLEIQAVIITADSLFKQTFQDIDIDRPEQWEPGATYTLKVTSNAFQLSSSIDKNTQQEVYRNFERRLAKVRQELIKDGLLHFQSENKTL